jgi:hypothetical protein
MQIYLSTMRQAANQETGYTTFYGQFIRALHARNEAVLPATIRA